MISFQTCQKYKKNLINYDPTITYVTPEDSIYNKYTEVYVYGSNFFPNGSSFVKLGNIEVSVSYYSSNLVTFIVPNNIGPGTYTLNVVNNISYSPINVTSVPPSQLSKSNSVNFIIIS